LITVQCELTRLSWVKIYIYLMPILTNISPTGNI